MAEKKATHKRRLSINLSLFANNSNNPDQGLSMSKSPKQFEEPNGVVGLGILAAMDNKKTANHHEGLQDSIFTKNRAAVLAISPKSSNPIPILSQKSNFLKNSVKKRPSFEEMEMCEEYTCVISHAGNNLVKKKEYFDGDLLGVREGSVKNFSVAGGVGGATSACGMETGSSAAGAQGYGGVAAGNWTADFLNSCFLCKKKLHGLDIFMYRGEQAFCSAECRCNQIAIDEHREKCGSGMIKGTEYSVSPCSGPMQCFAGVAAA